MRLHFRPKPKSSGLEVKANLEFQDKMSTFNALMSTNKVSIFKFTIEDKF